MKFNKLAAVGAVALTAAIALAGCSSSSTPVSSTTSKPAGSGVVFKVDPSLTGTITAGGSSAQANAETAWTSAFNAQVKGITINYDKSQGSGGGVTNWLAGSYDFAGSDAPLKPAQVSSSQASCGTDGAVNLPIYLDGVAIIYNLPGVSNLKLSAATIAKIFSLKITSWNDPAIVADNPNAKLPTTAITTVSRSDGSGTTQNFTNYLSAVDPTDWTYPASNAWPVKGSSAQQGGSGVVNTVKAGTGTIGYADHSAIGDVPAAAVQAGSSKDFVTFSQSGATAAFAAAATTTPTSASGDLSLKFDYSKLTDKSAYPIPLVSYQILCKTFKSSAQLKITKAYVGFIASTNGQKVASVNAGSAPIPDSMLTKIQATLATLK